MTIPWLSESDPFPPVETALRDPNGLLAAGGIGPLKRPTPGCKGAGPVDGKSCLALPKRAVASNIRCARNFLTFSIGGEQTLRAN